MNKGHRYHIESRQEYGQHKNHISKVSSFSESSVCHIPALYLLLVF